ncbi:hypothetical protein FRC15_002227 [Serendipita sp. 397]|nr:hypothetical protein FRC15_002227 [Serendipita sp. 397]
MYSLPPQARGVGDEASSERLDLVGLVTPGRAAVHTLAKTTAMGMKAMTTTTEATGMRKRGVRGSSGGGIDTPSTETAIDDDDDDLGEKKDTGGRIGSAKSGATLTLSKSRVGAKGGVVLRRTIPVPNSIRSIFDRRGILSNVAVLALTLLFNLFVLLSSLTGLRMRLEWEKEKKYGESDGGDDDTRNAYELDQMTSTPRPNRLPFTSSFFSSAPAPTSSSSSSPPPLLAHFVVLPTSTIHAQTIHAQSPSGSGQSTIQGRGTGGAGAHANANVYAHAHVLYKGTHTDTLRFFVNGKALDPWSIVHTSFEFLSQSQSQSPSQEGQTPQSQESEKGDDFHEFLLKIEDRHVTNANSSAYNREGEGGGEGVELQIVSSY